MRPRVPNLVVLAAPNGSGKSSFFDRRLAKWGLPFVNPDLIAKEIAPEDPPGAALRAARIADAQRKRYLEEGVSFVTEGIRPDPSLLAEARRLGFFTRVVFVCLESPDLNVARVSLRILQGGHSVPEDAIVARYGRALSLKDAVRVADQFLLIDNSVRFRQHRVLARFKEGRLVTLNSRVPSWANGVFGNEFEQFLNIRRPQ